MKKCYYNKNGYVVLITVLLVGAVGLSIAISIILLGLGQARSGATTDQLNQARAAANTCAEEGLQQIRDLDSYTGTGNLSLDNGTCEYTVIDQGGDNREIRASGTVGQIERKIKVTTDSISPTINIVSWQELSDF